LVTEHTYVFKCSNNTQYFFLDRSLTRKNNNACLFQISGDAGLTALAPALVRIPVVHLSSNFISDEGAAALATAVGRAVAADARQQSGRDVGSSESSASNANDDDDNNNNRRGRRPGVHNKLAELHLANNDIGPEGCTQLATNAVSHNPTLAVLVLSFNPVGAEGAQALAAALKVSTTTTRFNGSSSSSSKGPGGGGGDDDSGGEGGGDGGEGLVRVGLVDLRLSRCRVGDQGASALGTALGSEVVNDGVMSTWRG
jgi:hypothetical protein